MREELHHLVDLLPEAELRPALELIRAHAAGDHGPETDLPFFASLEADPDLADAQHHGDSAVMVAWSGDA